MWGGAEANKYEVPRRSNERRGVGRFNWFWNNLHSFSTVSFQFEFLIKRKLNEWKENMQVWDADLQRCDQICQYSKKAACKCRVGLSVWNLPRTCVPLRDLSPNILSGEWEGSLTPKSHCNTPSSGFASQQVDVILYFGILSTQKQRPLRRVALLAERSRWNKHIAGLIAKVSVCPLWGRWIPQRKEMNLYLLKGCNWSSKKKSHIRSKKQWMWIKLFENQTRISANSHFQCITQQLNTAKEQRKCLFHGCLFVEISKGEARHRKRVRFTALGVVSCGKKKAAREHSFIGDYV